VYNAFQVSRANKQFQFIALKFVYVVHKRVIYASVKTKVRTYTKI